MQLIEGFQRSIAEGNRYGFNIYVAKKSAFPEEFRYGRRPLSFKGPRNRGAAPIHEINPHPVWHGH